jgi:GNAT superfamily N-acetyltransferase
MNSDIVIRPYEPRDESEVVELVRQLQRHEGLLYDRMSPPEDIGAWYVASILRETREAAGEVLVALHGGAVAGYATLLARVSSEDERDEMVFTYAYIGDLVVEVQSRGKGIGRALLAECERRARQAGRKWLRITVLAANHSAHGAYERFGFTDLFRYMEKPLS